MTAYRCFSIKKVQATTPRQ